MGKNTLCQAIILEQVVFFVFARCYRLIIVILNIVAKVTIPDPVPELGAWAKDVAHHLPLNLMSSMSQQTSVVGQCDAHRIMICVSCCSIIRL